MRPEAGVTRRSLLAVFGIVAGGLTIGSLSECTTSTTDSTWLTPPTTAAALVAPFGATIKAHFHATGAQVYTCTVSSTSGGGPGGGGSATPASPPYGWVLKGPDSQLFDEAGAVVGRHSVGPTWASSLDGSSVVGTKVAQSTAPRAGAVPWLLLRASSTSGAGVFSTVTFIQRVETVGGVAPPDGCDAHAVGSETRSDYSADYFFYEGGSSPNDAAAGTPG